MACPEFVTLNNGANMPLLGYGTWQAKDSVLEEALQQALEAGYRHIDTAFVYENEHVIGRVLADGWFASNKLRREDVFVVTKLPPKGLHAGGPEQYLAKSLEALRLDYVDMYLVHFPLQFEPKNVVDHIAIWKEMEAQVDAGHAKAIGLSNFNQRQIQAVLDNCRIRPANLQVELHLYMQQKPLVEFCRRNGIAVTAYSPIGSPGSAPLIKNRFGMDIQLPDLINNNAVVEVAKKHQRQPGQVLLKHIVQHGIVAIPKSVNRDRIAQNINLFDFTLDPREMAKLDALDQGREGRIFSFKPPGMSGDDPNYPFNEYP